MRRERGPRSDMEPLVMVLPKRFCWCREMLSRVLHSAVIASQAAHTMQEVSHGLSSCAETERGPVCEHAIDVWRGQRKSLPDDHSAKCEATMFFFRGWVTCGDST